MQISATIKSLIIYPVKSLAGIEVERCQALTTGLKFDRQFMLVDEKGRFLTQRQIPKLALFKTLLSSTCLSFSYAEKSCKLTLKCLENVAESFIVKIWKDECYASEPDESVSEWFSNLLERKVRLVSLSQLRPQSAPERFGNQTTTFFADAAPYLISLQASLDELNRILTLKDMQKVDMRRFRPNVVLESDLPAFSEHNLTRAIAKGCEFQLIDHCQRCIVTTIDQDTAQKDPQLEPFKTVAEINPMPSNKHAPAFGVNAVLRWPGEQACELRVGDKFILS